MDAKRAVAIAIAASLGAVAGYSHAATDAASATVYKCKQANGGVLYQDYPCKNGVVVDVKPDAADPAAIARLERAQALYERDAARRRADEASEERRAAFERMRSEGASTQDYAAQADDFYLPAYPFYVPQARPRVKAHASRVGDDQRRNSHEHRVPAIVRRPRGG